jgi:class 3 adenylate cyclase
VSGPGIAVTTVHPTITITEPGRAPLHVVVRRPLEVGRDCDGLLLGDPLLSRRHLRLSAVGDRLSVQDLGSTNGTSVGGSVLVGTVVLQPGDVVEFGRCRLELDDATKRVADSGGDPLRRSSIDLVAAAATVDPLPSTLTSGGTRTIVFSDIEQSTRRALTLGDERWMALLAVHSRLVRRHVQRSGGIEVKALGDGFMLAFPGARSAVLCSIDIMRSVEAHARSHPTEALRIRIGMHTGEATVEDSNLFGRPVVVAARIANLAHGGEILVSSLVREIVESRGEFRFGDSREVELNGLDGRLRLHPVLVRSAGD